MGADEPPFDGETVELLSTIEQIHSSSLMVNVDYLALVDLFGDEEAWIVLGKLKDLLG